MMLLINKTNLIIMAHQIEASLTYGAIWVPYKGFKEKHPSRKKESSCFVSAHPKLYTQAEIDYFNDFFKKNKLKHELKPTGMVKIDPVLMTNELKQKALPGSDTVANYVNYQEERLLK